MNILTSKHTRKSSIALGEALNCPVYNPYSHEFYRGEGLESGVNYNMGCSFVPFREVINQPASVSVCIDKVKTFELLKEFDVLTVPYTRNINKAQEWLDEDRIVVNRTTIIGKANEGLTYSYKDIEDCPNVPLNSNAKIWTRYVNHTRELRAYTFKGQDPLIFEKVEVGGYFNFKPIRASNKFLEQVKKAQEAFSGLIFAAFDVLECVTGDYYVLECNSAPSLLVHNSIIPKLKETIECQ